MITLANIRRAIRNICRRLDILETKGKSVYEVAVESGFEGTVDEWLDSLKGEEGKSAYEVYAKSLISIADDVLIIDHTNFAEARHTKLEAYYSHYPLVAQGDGETWPPYRVEAFPYLYVGYEFDGHTTIRVYYKKELKLTWKPSAQIETQDINGQNTGILVDRTYGIISLPDDLGLTEFTESSKGNKILADIKNFKVELVKDELLSEETWLASLKGDKGDQGIQGPKGDTGDAFNIYREYASASLMNDDKDNVPVGKFVIINSDVEDPDNSKLFIRTNNLLDYPTGFKFLTDLSGALGIRGPQGIQGILGIQGIQGEQGNPGINGITPHIDQTTGNWFIGETNTNVHAEGPQGPSVQSDWNQSDNTLLDYIKNKPQVYTKSEIDSKFINHDFVEIGGIKWATKNIGAENITDGGLYFQWADTQGYTAALVGTGSGQKLFDWSNYKYNESGNNNPSSSDMSKYNAIDEKTVLDVSDDAATAAWGNSWRMPTNEEFGALINAANIVWTNNYNNSGVAGAVCTDKTDNTKVLFFPAAGYCYGGNITDNNSIGGYWSSSLNSSYISSYNFIINPYASILNYLNRYYGRSVRAVVNDSNVKMPTLSDVAYSGDYNDLNNKPTIPAAQVQSDWNQSNSSALNYIKNKPDIYTKKLVNDKFDYVEIAGTKWATKNVGADEVTDIGLYFLWGDIEGYTEDLIGNDDNEKYFGKADYKYGSSEVDRLGDMIATKYNSSDHLTVLEDIDDAARANEGISWRIPTKEEFLALINATNAAWTSDYKGSGAYGVILTDKTDNSKELFFHEVFEASEGSISYSIAGYWTSTLHNYTHVAKILEISPGLSLVNIREEHREYGLPIRAVLDEPKVSKVTYTGNYEDLNNKPDVYTKNETDTKILSFMDPEYIEIGGIKWATKNLGAINITDYGLYFLWADTLGYTLEQILDMERIALETGNDSLPPYKYYDSANLVYTKYDGTDNKVILEDVDNAAKSLWGKEWTIPNAKHFNILVNSTTSTWVTNYLGSGVNGRLFTDTLDSSKTLFFPASGSYGGTYIRTTLNLSGDYWTSNIEQNSASYIEYSGGFGFSNNGSGSTGSEYRYELFPIRAIIDKSESEVNNTKEYIVNRLLPTDYEYVDLELPSGTLWAKCNVGASTETDYGNYYKYGSGVLQFISGSANPPHYTGNENPLPASVDTATLVMGKMWHIPTYTQVNELWQYTIQREVSINGVRGVICYGLNGNYVFFPYSGGYNYSYSSGTDGNFWTSSLDTSNNPYYISLANKCIGMFSTSLRDTGKSIRGVIDKESISAFSGDYNDLNNKPTIPLIWRGTQVQYDALSPNYDANTIYIIT